MDSLAQPQKEATNRLEKAGVNSNWIDQILGHQLINSRDACSLPTDEELSEAYLRPYQFIRVYKDINKSAPESPKEEPKQATPALTEQILVEENYPVEDARNMEQVKRLLSKGYRYEMDYEGVKLFVRIRFSLMSILFLLLHYSICMVNIAVCGRYILSLPQSVL